MNTHMIRSFKPRLQCLGKDSQRSSTASNPISRIFSSALPVSRRIPFQLKSAGPFRPLRRSVWMPVRRASSGIAPRPPKLLTTLSVGLFGTLLLVPVAILHNAERKFPDKVDSILPPQMSSAISYFTSPFGFDSKITLQSEGVSAAINTLNQKRVEAVRKHRAWRKSKRKKWKGYEKKAENDLLSALPKKPNKEKKWSLLRRIALL